MGFIDSANVMLPAGMAGLLCGFGLYFGVLAACRFFGLEGYWRLSLTLASIAAVCVPEIWQLTFHANDFRRLFEPAFSPEALALAIKTKLVLGIVGHVAGFGVQVWLIDR